MPARRKAPGLNNGRAVAVTTLGVYPLAARRPSEIGEEKPMDQIGIDRLRNVAVAREQLFALVNDAEAGMSTHILRGSKVAAHLVPPDALILEGRVLQILVAATAWGAIDARRGAAEEQSIPTRETSDFILVLNWLKARPEDYAMGLAIYVAVLVLHHGGRIDLNIDTVIEFLGGWSALASLGPSGALRKDVELALLAAPEAVEAARRAAADPDHYFSPLAHMVSLNQGHSQT